jgi:ferritin
MQNRSAVSDVVNAALNNIVLNCFYINRQEDRNMTELSVQFTMNQTSDTLHPILAHSPLALADLIGDYQDQRNALTAYGLVPEDNTNYNSVLEMFEKSLVCWLNLEKAVSDALEVCLNENDATSRIFLESFLLKIIPFTAQVILLCDKIEAYGETNTLGRMLFDDNIESFIIVKGLILKQ